VVACAFTAIDREVRALHLDDLVVNLANLIKWRMQLQAGILPVLRENQRQIQVGPQTHLPDVKHP
jgi:hypothetical protein